MRFIWAGCLLCVASPAMAGTVVGWGRPPWGVTGGLDAEQKLRDADKQAMLAIRRADGAFLTVVKRTG